MVHTFANTINTGGGTTKRASAAHTTSVNKYAEDNKPAEGQRTNLTVTISGKGLAAVISVKVSEPQFGARPRQVGQHRGQIVCAERSVTNS